MEWNTFIVFGLVPVILFYSIGLIIILVVFKLLIDSWARTRYEISETESWKKYDTKKHNWV